MGVSVGEKHDQDSVRMLEHGSHASRRRPMLRDNQDENAHCLTENAPLAKVVASCEMLPKVEHVQEHST